MSAFLQRFGHLVQGILSGFDRLFFRGTLRNLAYAQGLQHYLWANRIIAYSGDIWLYQQVLSEGLAAIRRS